ncbi:MAG TPA: metallophosphoesterase [Kofleriaceae bacterium]|nr:metallophosphoesterase [Kofleriaceae bacterium]
MQIRAAVLVSVGVVLAGCSFGESGGSGGGGGDGGGGGSDQADAAPGGPDDQADGGAPAEPVRFVVMGDTGEGNEAQRQVAIRIRDLCAAEGCELVLLLGDNIYDDGVASVDDPQWLTKFEEPYADIDLPFYAVLGNHDYGGELLSIDLPGIGNEWHKGPIEVAYTDQSDKWRMPATFYTLRVGNVGIIALDTNSILWDNRDHGDQREWYPQALAELDGAEWIVVAGHHPYRSNGTHGNAGQYDAPELGGIELPNPLPIQNGGEIKAFFEEVVCGTADVVLAGHDHSRQWLDEPDALCGAELIISGAGAKTTEIRDRGNAARFEDASEAGFLFIEVEGNQLRGQFYDAEGNLDFEHVVTR